MIRAIGIDEPPTPRVLGVDEWAWRKGQIYGTILCDLELGRVVISCPTATPGASRPGCASTPASRSLSATGAVYTPTAPVRVRPQRAKLRT